MATEKRLIYADSGQESVEYLKRHLIVGDSDFLRGYLQGAEALADGLAKFPPVDAVEVVHGEWSTIEDDYCGLIALRCSECNAEWWFEDDSSFEKYSYCPNCGAKMDLEEQG